MKVAVVLASAGRPEYLDQALSFVRDQSYAVSQIVISVPTSEDVWSRTVAKGGDVDFVYGAKGLTKQRNAGVAALDADIDLIAFFDDDAVLDDSYLRNAVRHFVRDPDIVGLTGNVLLDGVRMKRQLGLDESVAALSAATVDEASPEEATTVSELYGCNMVVRNLGQQFPSFDESLPLYGWLEDLDFSRQLKIFGYLVRAEDCWLVHQGSTSGGRTQHERFGYSQIANPYRIFRRGRITVGHALMLIGRPVIANVLGSVFGIDRHRRRNRLRGNAAAVRHAARGKMRPQNAETMFGSN